MNAVDSVEKDLISEVFVLIVAGGIGSRLIGIGSNDVPNSLRFVMSLVKPGYRLQQKDFWVLAYQPKIL